MKKLLILFIIIASCSNHDNQSRSTSAEIMQKAQAVINRLVPDKRDKIVTVKFEMRNDTIILFGATDYPALLDSLQRELKKSSYFINNKVRLLPETGFKDKMGLTRLSVANLRAKPKHSAELVSQTLLSTPVKIYEEANGFYHIKTPEGYYAWVDAAGISIIDKKAYKQWLHEDKVVVTAQTCKIFQKPDMLALPLSDAVINDIFSFVSRDDGFTKVQYPDGRLGYVLSENVLNLSEFDAANKNYLTSNDIVKSAKEYMGVPYLWGGTSYKALDCSGFTKTVYAEFSYLLPRDASQQVKIGNKIDISDDLKNLQPADLLFFGRIQDAKEKITHVAIYIGDGKIIHATGEVKIESLRKGDEDYNEYRRKSLLQARRIIGHYPQNLMQFYYQN